MMTYLEFEDVRVIRQTDKAGLFDIDGEEVWIPWSCIEENENNVSKDGQVGTLAVAEWFAQKEGLA